MSLCRNPLEWSNSNASIIYGAIRSVVYGVNLLWNLFLSTSRFLPRKLITTKEVSSLEISSMRLGKWEQPLIYFMMNASLSSIPYAPCLSFFSILTALSFRSKTSYTFWISPNEPDPIFSMKRYLGLMVLSCTILLITYSFMISFRWVLKKKKTAKILP